MLTERRREFFAAPKETAMRHRERVLRGEVASEHVVQLFDDQASLADAVAAFLHEGYAVGDTLLVVARPGNWIAAATQLMLLGCPVDNTTLRGRLVILDAATTIGALMKNGDIEGPAFDQHIGALVHRLSTQAGGRLRVYGEMVDILAEQGRFDAARQLEALWNQLGERCSFVLLCGYLAAHFIDEKTAEALRAICSDHTRATTSPGDLLARWLLSGRRPTYHIDL